jgi:hypothetical protein
VQSNGFAGVLASRVADEVVQRLVEMRVLPEGSTRNHQVDWTRVGLTETTRNMVGRDKEVKAVVSALNSKAGAAVLVGGPGEGKPTVAMRAGLEFCMRGGCSGGAHVVDFQGALERGCLYAGVFL